MPSRYSEIINTSNWCHNCYSYRHNKCNGIRKSQGNKRCECTKCANKQIEWYKKIYKGLKKF